MSTKQEETDMHKFNMTIQATATRMVGDQTGAEETLQSEFIVHGSDALSASKGQTELFKEHYADLDDLEITDILIVLHDEEDRVCGLLKEQAS